MSKWSIETTLSEVTFDDIPSDSVEIEVVVDGVKDNFSYELYYECEWLTVQQDRCKLTLLPKVNYSSYQRSTTLFLHHICDMEVGAEITVTQNGMVYSVAFEDTSDLELESYPTNAAPQKVKKTVICSGGTEKFFVKSLKEYIEIGDDTVGSEFETDKTYWGICTKEKQHVNDDEEKYIRYYLYDGEVWRYEDTDYFDVPSKDDDGYENYENWEKLIEGDIYRGKNENGLSIVVSYDSDNGEWISKSEQEEIEFDGSFRYLTNNAKGKQSLTIINYGQTCLNTDKSPFYIVTIGHVDDITKISWLKVKYNKATLGGLLSYKDNDYIKK